MAEGVKEQPPMLRTGGLLKRQQGGASLPSIVVASDEDDVDEVQTAAAGLLRALGPGGQSARQAQPHLLRWVRAAASAANEQG